MIADRVGWDVVSIRRVGRRGYSTGMGTLVAAEIRWLVVDFSGTMAACPTFA
jgi:hypothetical protein